MRPPTKRNASAGTLANSQSRYDDTAKPTAPANPAQHSRRPDRYKLHGARWWTSSGADAAVLLACLWNVRGGDERPRQVAEEPRLIEAAYQILEKSSRHPFAPSVIGCSSLVDSRHGKANTNRVSVQLVSAREDGVIPWEWIVDEARGAPSPSPHGRTPRQLSMRPLRAIGATTGPINRNGSKCGARRAPSAARSRRFSMSTG